MSRRGVVLILAVAIAAAVAIPALADPGPSARSASVKGLSKRALAKAKKSLRVARAARRQARAARREAASAEQFAGRASVAAAGASSVADGARSAANEAKSVADGARADAGEALAALAATRAVSGFAAGEEATASEAFVALPGGPRVSVTVPASGLIQVWAQAEVGDGGAVSLYQDGDPVPGQAGCTSGEEPSRGILFASPGGSEGGEGTLALGTPASLPFCATIGPPGPVLLRASPGRRSFELRYAAACSCSGAATFSARRLVVAPLP